MCQGLEETSLSVELLFVSLFCLSFEPHIWIQSNLSPPLFILRWPLVHCSIAVLVPLGMQVRLPSGNSLQKKIQRSSFMYFRVV